MAQQKRIKLLVLITIILTVILLGPYLHIQFSSDEEPESSGSSERHHKLSDIETILQRDERGQN